MALAAGTKLGPYEVTGAIGAGGMGEVYEARDTKLGRAVAIKVLPAAFVNDPERLSRFQREARMLAALNHPNIATIYGLEHSDSTQFLVMELVPGEALADRLKSGPVPVDESLKIAAQIAEALEAAHEKNIIHRDLKPANVKVTPEGKVKVLDFGLAKAFEGDLTNEDMSNSPTLTMAATMQGVVLGTAAYMSPEQARGKAVDKRTDIWAFGCVLYELLTGKQAFHGETVTDITAKILTAEPDWKALPVATPPKIPDLLRRCLQKDKSLRMRDAGDARIEILEALSAPVPVARLNGFAGTLGGWRLPLLTTLVALIVAAVAGLAVWFLKPPPSTPVQPVTRTTITLPPGDHLAPFLQPVLALSPDGTRLVYAAVHDGKQQLYLRPMDSEDAAPIAGTEGATSPFFSPDSQWLGFVAERDLKKLSLDGGIATSLATVGAARGASWASQGTISFTNDGSVLRAIADSGGTSQALVRLVKPDTSSRWPEILPGSKAVVFAGGHLNSPAIVAYEIGSGARRELAPAGTQPHYAASGHLIYAQGGDLLAVAFDPERLEIKGKPVRVVQGVMQSAMDGATQYSVSNTGTLAYVRGGVLSARSTLVWVDRKGNEQALHADVRAYETPRLSPDQRRIAVSIDGQIWLYDLSRDALTRLTVDGNINNRPVWTPDGKRIAFNSDRDGALNIYWQPADGSGAIERLASSEFVLVPQAFSRDGQLLTFHEVNPTTGADIWVLHLGDHKAQVFLRTAHNEGDARLSPDGHWIAYLSDESGRDEVYVQPYPGPGGKWQVSTNGGTEVSWNPNGRELFYRNEYKMMAVDVTTQPDFTVSKPRILFEKSYLLSQVRSSNYDVSDDGQRFLMVKPEDQTASSATQISIVQNWFEELKRRVPTGK